MYANIYIYTNTGIDNNIIEMIRILISFTHSLTTQILHVMSIIFIIISPEN